MSGAAFTRPPVNEPGDIGELDPAVFGPGRDVSFEDHVVRQESLDRRGSAGLAGKGSANVVGIVVGMGGKMWM